MRYRRNTVGYVDCVRLIVVAVCWCIGSASVIAEASPGGADVDDAHVAAALAAEQRRIATVARVTPACVCVYDRNQRGGGSGVIIDAQGHGLTNYHVVAGMLSDRQGLGGLADGRMYDLEVLGIDPTGDVALFRLTGREEFTFAELGDSEAVRPGDTVLAIGNPFVLSEDHTPSVSMGRVTGTHRYQRGQGNALVYTDCIQTDAAINPGNSGGPLFDLAGRIIGINGRISLAAGVRGRFNVGAGYAISINQIKRFLPALRAGLEVRHGTMQATVNRACLFDELVEDGPAWKVGIRPGDKLLRFGGREVVSDNQFASLLGTYPEDWPVSICWLPRANADGPVTEARHAIARLERLAIHHEGAFTVDPQVNRRALERVVERFQSGIGITQGPGTAEWRWTSRRMPVGSGAAETDAAQRWAHVRVGDGTSEHRRSGSGGTVAERIVCDEEGVHLVDGERRYVLPPARRLPLLAMHVLRENVVAGASAVPADEWSHVGGDAVVRQGDDGRVVESNLLEVIETQRPDGTNLRYAFDEASGMLRRIVARDEASGAEAVIDLDDYGDVGGFRWPLTLEVRVGTNAYRARRDAYEVGR
ncbi:MAG: trypsin-like serine protease [bacterium]|nr:trypsin-like serine protease [bacterium]